MTTALVALTAETIIKRGGYFNGEKVEGLDGTFMAYDSLQDRFILQPAPLDFLGGYGGSAKFGASNKPLREWSIDDIDILIAMRSAGKPWAEIGLAVKRNHAVCREKHARLKFERDLPDPPKVYRTPISDDEAKKIMALKASGCCYREIGNKLQRSRDVIRNWFRTRQGREAVNG